MNHFHRINDENMKKNIEKAEKLKAINKLYNKVHIKGAQSDDKKAASVDWLKRFAEVTAKKPTLEEVKTLIEQADRIQLTPEDSSERRYLETMIQAGKTFFNKEYAFLLEKMNIINAENEAFQSETEKTPAAETLEDAEQSFVQIVSRTKELLQKRLKLEDVEEQIAKGKNLEIDFTNVVGLLEKEVERVKAWQNKKVPTKVSEFMAHIGEMSSLVIFVPEMTTILEQFEQCKKLQLRLTHMLQLIELSTQKKDKKKPAANKANQMIDEAEETAEQATGPRVPLKDAQELIQEIEAQEFNFEEDFHSLKEKIKHCETLQQKIKKQLESKLESSHLKTLQKDVEKVVFKFPELEEIQQKVIILPLKYV